MSANPNIVALFGTTAPATPSHNERIAQQFAAMDIPVVPCRPVAEIIAGKERKAKSPIGALAPNGIDDATTDPQIISAWWARYPDALVGLGLAKAGLIAIDADRHGGPDGVAAWETLCDQNGLDTSAHPVVATTGGGFHHYFRAPRGWEPTDGEGELRGSGINVRGAGFTIAPACVLPDGRSYQPVDGTPPLALDIPEAPAWLIQMIGKSRPKSEDTQTPASEQDTPAVLARIDAYLDGEAGAVEGMGGDAHTLQVALNCRDMGGSEAVVLERMSGPWNEKCSPPWDDDELAVKVANAFLYAQNAPATQTPAVDFVGVDDVPVPAFRPGTAMQIAAARGAQQQRVRFLSDAGALEQVRYLIKDLLPATGVGLLAGPSRVGKTFLVGELAGALTAASGSFFGRPVRERVGVLIIVAEGGGTIGPRLEGLRLHRLGGIDAAALPIAWAEIDGPDEIGELVVAASAEMQERFGLRLGVVFIDTLSAAYGFDPLDHQTGTVTLQRLDRLAEAAGVVIIGTAHYGKDARQGVLGASSWTQRADFILAATAAEISEISGEVKDRKLSLTKSRYSETGPISAYDLQSVCIGADADGDPINVAIVVPVERAVIDSHRSLYLAGLDGLMRAAGEVVPDSGGRRGVARKLLREHCYDEWRGENARNKTQWFERAEKALLKSGRIEHGFNADGQQVIMFPVTDPASLF